MCPVHSEAKETETSESGQRKVYHEVLQGEVAQALKSRRVLAKPFEKPGEGGGSQGV